MNTAENKIPDWWVSTPEGKKQLAEELAEKENQRLVLVRELAEREAKLNAVLPQLNKAVEITKSKEVIEQGRLDAIVLARYAAEQAVSRAVGEAGLDHLRKELAKFVPPALDEFLSELDELKQGLRSDSRFIQDAIEDRRMALETITEIAEKAEALKTAAIEDVAEAIEELRRQIPEFVIKYSATTISRRSQFR